MNGNRSLMRMEKRAVNKLGLFLIILIAIAFFGGGGYLLYKNRNNLDFSFPWEKNNNEAKTEKEAVEKRKQVSLERQKISVNSTDIIKVYDIDTRFLSAEYSVMDGYVFKIQMYNSTLEDISFNINYLAIDDYQIDYEDKIVLQHGKSNLYELKIPVSELDKYNIESFETLQIFTSKVKNKETEEQKEQTITVKNELFTNNTQLPTKNTNMGKALGLTIYYYKTEETEDSTDVYFLLTNEDARSAYEITINAYKINDKIITNNDFREKIYPKRQKVVVLSIPKKDYKTVDKLTLSFFVLDNNDIYLTKTTTIEPTKN